jgi:acetyl-CoA C-acetyltransferase
MSMDAWIVDAIRTPRTRAVKGALAGVAPIDLVGSLLGSMRERQPDASLAGDMLLGCVTAVNGQGANIAHTAILNAAWPTRMPGLTLNRYCCSGLDAVNQAAAMVHAGVHGMVLAGGVESLSHVPMFSDNGPWYADATVSATTSFVHMAVAADLVATRHGISREDCDRFAMRSHERALKAAAESDCSAIIPLQRHDGVSVLVDDGPRRPDMARFLAAPALLDTVDDGRFRTICARHFPDSMPLRGTHTVMTSPLQVDGASLVLLASGDTVRDGRSKARARVCGFATAAAHPVEMLDGHVKAAEQLLHRLRLKACDIDIFEINESFAASALYFQRYFCIPDEKINVRGGAIALGHPLGATGGVLIGMALESLAATGGRRALVAIPGGGGSGVATVIEVV